MKRMFVLVGCLGPFFYTQVALGDAIFLQRDQGTWSISDCELENDNLEVFTSGFRSRTMVCASTDSSITESGYYLFLECGSPTGSVTYMGDFLRTSMTEAEINLVEYHGASGAPDITLNLHRCERSNATISNLNSNEVIAELTFYEISLIQEILKDLGFYKYEVDGVWGRFTETAVQHFAWECCAEHVSSPDALSSYIMMIIAEGSLEGHYEPQTNLDADSGALHTESWMPEWMSIRVLGPNATVRDWAQATNDTRLATAASYYIAPRPMEIVQLQAATGELLRGAIDIMDCLNQMIQVGVMTNQISLQQTIQPVHSGSCVVAMAFPR